MTPAEFLERFRSGDEYLFATVRERYGRLVRSRLRKQAGSYAEISDLEQDAWLLVWLHRSEFKGRVDEESTMERAFRSWLLRLCQTVISRHRRRERGRAIRDVMDVQALHDASSERSSEFSFGEETDGIWDVVMDLPSRRRSVFLHRVIEGLSVIETAAVMGCSHNTVKTTLKAALAAVRRHGIVARDAGRM